MRKSQGRRKTPARRGQNNRCVHASPIGRCRGEDRQRSGEFGTARGRGEGCDSVISAMFCGEANSRNRKEEASGPGSGNSGDGIGGRWEFRSGWSRRRKDEFS